MSVPQTIEIQQQLTSIEKKSHHNKKYYDSHKLACFRKSLIYDIRKFGRIPKKEIMKRYDLNLDEFIKIFATWAVNKSLTQDKKEQLSQLVVQYFELKLECPNHISVGDLRRHGSVSEALKMQME